MIVIVIVICIMLSSYDYYSPVLPVLTAISIPLLSHPTLLLIDSLSLYTHPTIPFSLMAQPSQTLALFSYAILTITSDRFISTNITLFSFSIIITSCLFFITTIIVSVVMLEPILLVGCALFVFMIVFTFILVCYC